MQLLSLQLMGYQLLKLKLKGQHWKIYAMLIQELTLSEKTQIMMSLVVMVLKLNFKVRTMVPNFVFRTTLLNFCVRYLLNSSVIMIKMLFKIQIMMYLVVMVLKLNFKVRTMVPNFVVMTKQLNFFLNVGHWNLQKYQEMKQQIQLQIIR